MILNILESSLINIWPSLVIVTVAVVSIRYSYLRSHRDRLCFYKEFWSFLAVIYVLLLYQLITRVDLNNTSGVNLVPFAEILRHDINSELFYLNVIGNIVLFIPFGYMIAAYVKPKKIWTNMFIAIIVSSSIEFVQLNIGRSFDVDDIILNTVGCIVGFLIYVASNAVARYLPDFLKSDWLKNLICIIIAICMVIYVLNIMGMGIAI